jgi:hypothetical protein
LGLGNAFFDFRQKLGALSPRRAPSFFFFMAIFAPKGSAMVQAYRVERRVWNGSG